MSDIENEIMKKFNQSVQDSLDKVMLGTFQTTAKPRPLTLLEVAYKIRQNSNQWLVFSLYDAVEFARKMRSHGFKLQRVRSGYWLLLDMQNQGMVTAEINITRFLEKGQCYIMDKPNIETWWQKQRDEQMAKMFEELRPKDLEWRTSLVWAWNKKWGLK